MSSRRTKRRNKLKAMKVELRKRAKAVAIAERALFSPPNPFDDYEEGTFIPSLWAKRMRDMIDNEILTTIITGARDPGKSRGDTIQIQRAPKIIGGDIK